MFTNGLPYHERELLLRIASGDEAAFGELLDHYHIRIYHTVLRLSGDQWMAEEVVQDTFLRVWLRRESLPDIKNFSAWLGTVAENMTFDAIRRARSRKNNVSGWAGEFYQSIAPSTQEENRFMEILQDAVRHLPPRQQEVFQLIKIQGYKREEAAKIINISPETVKSHLEQAMRNVRVYCMARLDSSTLAILLLLQSWIVF